MQKALSGTALESLANAYIKAESEYGINALFLIGITAQESSWGKSDRAKNQNNLSGFAVYGNFSRGAYFDSREESIMKTAKLIKEGGYVNKGLKDIWSINKVYCPVEGFHWSNNINKIITQDILPKSYVK